MQTDFQTVEPPLPSPTAAPNNMLAIVSLGLGIAGFPFLCLSFVIAFCGCFSGLIGIGALITGFIARQQIKSTGEQGDTMALAGMLLGGTQVVLVICGVIASVLLVLANVPFDKIFSSFFK